MPASCLVRPPGSAFSRLPGRWRVIGPRFGASAGAMNSMDLMSCCGKRIARADHSSFPPLQRAQIVQLACLEPIAKGLHITHWTSADLARQAVSDGIVAAISPRTVWQILHEVDLQPHRTRYWKTARLDAEFKARAERVLWCYGNAENLAAHGLWVVCVDEMPNLQILERDPLRRAIPGSIEKQDAEYTSHATVQ